MQGMGGNPMMVQQRMQMQGAQMGQMGQMNPNMQQRMMRPGVQVQGMYVLCSVRPKEEKVVSAETEYSAALAETFGRIFGR